MTVLISDKEAFRANKITRDKKRHYIMLWSQFIKKGNNVNVHVPDNSIIINKAKNDRSKKRKRHIYTDQWRLFLSQQFKEIQRKSKEKIIPPNNIHILVRCI